jgi:NADP-dependent 3-hydroxy acid dehydrogenase YdfG
MTKTAIVLVTGIKLTPSEKKFSSGQHVTYLEHDNKSYKMNAAAGVMYSLFGSDYVLVGNAYNESDNNLLADMGLNDGKHNLSFDLLDKESVKKLVKYIAALKKKHNLPVHLVHYGGASDTKVDLPNNSLLAHTWDMKAEALKDLVENNCVTLINLVQEMKRQEIFKDQLVSKIVVISAAAAVRAKQMLGLDTVQKGAGHSLLRTMALDLTPENIFITEIMPGSTDTGFFDNDYTIKTAVDVTARLGYDVTEENYPVFTAEQIGDSVKYVLNANCNVREIVMLPYGQFPHLGA